MTILNSSPTEPGAKLPDGPKTSPILQILQGIFRPMEYLEAVRDRYGDIFTMRSLGFPPTIALGHPQAIQTVFTADPKLFDVATSNWILRPLLGENSLIQLDGLPHQRQRRLLTPHFHGERMRSYGQLICELTQQVMGQWEIGKPLCIHTSTQEISLRVILHAVFGLAEGAQYDQLREILSDWLNSFKSPWLSSFLFLRFLQQDLGPLSPWGRFLRQKQQIDVLLTAEIERRRTQPLGEDILSLMMLARDESGQPMTEAELRDELMTLLFAGHETTASALAWAFYWIHQSAEIKQQLLDELDTLSPEADPGAIAKLPYLSAVCSETLRIYPVVLFTFARILKAPLTIMGYQFEPGAVLAPCIYLTHHHPDLYPEPKRFRPERFLERQFSAYEYLPFGGGNRRCLGYAFALFEMKLVLATVLSQVKMTLIDNRPISPVRRGVTFTPSTGVQMVMTERYSAKARDPSSNSDRFTVATNSSIRS